MTSPQQTRYSIHGYEGRETAAATHRAREVSSTEAIRVNGDLDSITETLAKTRSYRAYREEHQRLLTIISMDSEYRRAVSDVRRAMGLSPLHQMDVRQCAAYQEGYPLDVYNSHLEEVRNYGKRQRDDMQQAMSDIVTQLKMKK